MTHGPGDRESLHSSVSGSVTPVTGKRPVAHDNGVRDLGPTPPKLLARQSLRPLSRGLMTPASEAAIRSPLRRSRLLCGAPRGMVEELRTPGLRQNALIGFAGVEGRRTGFLACRVRPRRLLRGVLTCRRHAELDWAPPKTRARDRRRSQPGLGRLPPAVPPADHRERLHMGSRRRGTVKWRVARSAPC